jgi:hypothetical protein
MNEKEIRSSVHVSRRHVTLCKAIILDLAKSKVSSLFLVSQVIEKNAVALPNPVVFGTSDDESVIKTVASYLSWHAAACEAIWALVHTGLLFGEGEWRGSLSSVQWRRVSSGSSSASSWNFDEFSIPVPQNLTRSLSSRSDPNCYLAEPSLYLSTIGVAGMHADVESSFIEAVKCFRADLYTASIVLLGRASEGAWLELGEALLKIVPAHNQKKYAKQTETLESPMTGPLKKVAAVLEIYEQKDDFGAVWENSKVRPIDLKTVVTWSDSVRDSRNTIHFGVAPAVPNTYEKVAALLIGAVPMIRTLYQVKGAADALPKNP